MTPDSAWRHSTSHIGDAVTMTVNGDPVCARKGETVAAAMLAEGAAFERDRAGNPRAPLCNMGTCFECTATINGRPLTRTCLIQAEQDMTVETTRRL